MAIYGDTFTPVNVLGLLTLIGGVVLYHWHKLVRLKAGEVRASKLGLAS